VRVVAQEQTTGASAQCVPGSTYTLGPWVGSGEREATQRRSLRSTVRG
jgi:hypothetical protein